MPGSPLPPVYTEEPRLPPCLSYPLKMQLEVVGKVERSLRRELGDPRSDIISTTNSGRPLSPWALAVPSLKREVWMKSPFVMEGCKSPPPHFPSLGGGLASDWAQR